ncbi:protein G12-like [Bacillus rossius redtenbacheri]|uniref:protein G12-like n=1 Tax=Bacillus rossius redtenbacheri TaxID=93214 RepID=UPI002FDD0B96
MKVLVVLVAVLGFTYGASVASDTNSTLQADFDAIISTIPIKNVTNLVLNYVANDKEAQDFISWISGAKFAVIWKAIFNSSEVKELMAWAYAHGVPIYKDINKFADLISMDHVSPRAGSTLGGVASFLDELFAMVNPQQLIANIKKQVAASADFKEFYDRLSSEQFHAFVHKIYRMKELQDQLTVLKIRNVPVEKIVTEIANVLGWKNL